jgi:hypothetical protein
MSDEWVVLEAERDAALHRADTAEGELAGLRARVEAELNGSSYRMADRLRAVLDTGTDRETT